MEVHIKSVKTKSQVGNIWVNERCDDNTERPQLKEN